MKGAKGLTGQNEKNEPGNDLPFPRGIATPKQSPLFWVQQKDRYLRQLLIRDIEAITSRRLVVFFGNRFVKGSDIQAGDVAYVAEVLGDVANAPLDILIETSGGETDATEAIISIIQQRSSDFRAIVANAAKSNGTMLAISARSIVMGFTSELGPLEPSLGGVPVSTLLLDEVKRENLVLYTAAQQALRQSSLMATGLLQTGMMRDAAPDKIEETVRCLTTRESYPSHGSVIDRREANRLGLKVEQVEHGDPFWDSVWLLYCMLDSDCRKAGYAKVFEGRARSLAVATPTGH